MKQFNLEEYLKNPSKKVVTRDGESVRIICTDYYGEKPIIAKIEESEYSYPFYEDGRFLSFGESSNCDLFFAPEKHEGWVNVYRIGGIGGLGCRCIFDSEEKARQCADEGAIATAKIEWEE